MSHQKWQLTGSKMTLEVSDGCQESSLETDLIFILYLHSSQFSLSTVTWCLHTSYSWLRGRSDHAWRPQKCSCSVNCRRAKLGVFLNYYNILFLKWISFLGRRIFCKDFSISGIPSECRNWSYSHWIQLERIWSSVHFTGFLCIWKQGRWWCKMVKVISWEWNLTPVSKQLVNYSCYPESKCVHLMSLMNLIEH